MSKRVYISADYSFEDGDRNVVETLNSWAADNRHIVDFVDLAAVSSGSISKTPDCRICDLKQEFNRQINASSAVIFVVGNKTAQRKAGCTCERVQKEQAECYCTPYKQNTNGIKPCKVSCTYTQPLEGDLGNINRFSYLQHEFEQAVKKRKKIIILYNSIYRQENWLPNYMKDYASIAHPFWMISPTGRRIGDYEFIKRELEYV